MIQLFMSLTKRSLAALALLVSLNGLLANEKNDTPINKIRAEDLISVFLDCNQCDFFYIQQAIPFVNYVRDKELAHVHVMITIHHNGSSGANYEINFIGSKEFVGKNNMLRYWAPSTNSHDDTRKGLAEMIKFGLISYVAATPIANQIVVSLKDNQLIEKKELADPWESWIFEVYAGSNFLFESEKSNLTARYGFFANKTTDDWKIRLRPYFNYGRLSFKTDSEVVVRESHRNGFEGTVIKSLDQHWSTGLFVNSLSSTFHNMNFNVEMLPGIEYSIFPYSEATRKSITVAYKFGVGYHNYLEETIFGKEEEVLWSHGLVASITFQQPWGNVRGGIHGSHFFHDLRSNRAEIYSVMNLRLFSGLALNFWGTLNLINDLVALPKGDLSLEDILLQQRRQATSYQAQGSVGLSYTFGSKFTNVVNPRF